VQAAFALVPTPTVASELRGAGEVKVLKVTLIFGGAAVGAAVFTGVGAAVGAAVFTGVGAAVGAAVFTGVGAMVRAGVAVGAGVGTEVGAGDCVGAGDAGGASVGACVVTSDVVGAGVAPADWLDVGAAEGPFVVEPGVASLALHAPSVKAAATRSAIRTRRMALPPSTDNVFGRESTVEETGLGHNRPNVPWLSDFAPRSAAVSTLPGHQHDAQIVPSSGVEFLRPGAICSKSGR
jgi:hypothetical protein